ncbi:MAG: hypothetical protein ABR530_08260 [Pyrinomonadaceae bacterium]
MNIRRKMLLNLTLMLLLGSAKVYACSCITMPDVPVKAQVRSALKESTAVFVGKVKAFEYRKGTASAYLETLPKGVGYETLVVKFEVAQWWKRRLPRFIYLETDQTKHSDGSAGFSSCDYQFKEGETYLVYAYRKENELTTSACSRTSPLSKAAADIKLLGRGYRPAKT